MRVILVFMPLYTQHSSAGQFVLLVAERNCLCWEGSYFLSNPVKQAEIGWSYSWFVLPEKIEFLPSSMFSILKEPIDYQERQLFITERLGFGARLTLNSNINSHASSGNLLNQSLSFLTCFLGSKICTWGLGELYAKEKVRHYYIFARCVSWPGCLLVLANASRTWNEPMPDVGIVSASPFQKHDYNRIMLT